VSVYTHRSAESPRLPKPAGRRAATDATDIGRGWNGVRDSGDERSGESSGEGWSLLYVCADRESCGVARRSSADR
jgi:hypothetical protein